MPSLFFYKSSYEYLVTFLIDNEHIGGIQQKWNILFYFFELVKSYFMWIESWCIFLNTQTLYYIMSKSTPEAF